MQIDNSIGIDFRQKIKRDLLVSMILPNFAEYNNKKMQ